jgi:hypothetical protein
MPLATDHPSMSSFTKLMASGRRLLPVKAPPSRRPPCRFHVTCRFLRAHANGPWHVLRTGRAGWRDGTSSADQPEKGGCAL